MSPKSSLTPRPVVEVAVEFEAGSAVADPTSAVEALATVTPTVAGPKVPEKPRPVPVVPK
jgi:hypothetical protein